MKEGASLARQRETLFQLDKLLQVSSSPRVQVGQRVDSAVMCFRQFVPTREGGPVPLPNGRRGEGRRSKEFGQRLYGSNDPVQLSSVPGESGGVPVHLLEEKRNPISVVVRRKQSGNGRVGRHLSKDPSLRPVDIRRVRIRGPSYDLREDPAAVGEFQPGRDPGGESTRFGRRSKDPRPEVTFERSP